MSATPILRLRIRVSSQAQADCPPQRSPLWHFRSGVVKQHGGGDEEVPHERETLRARSRGQASSQPHAYAPFQTNLIQ
jgi:hypothetical protein